MWEARNTYNISIDFDVMVYDEWLFVHELKATQVAWQDTWAQIWWTEALNWSIQIGDQYINLIFDILLCWLKTTEWKHIYKKCKSLKMFENLVQELPLQNVIDSEAIEATIHAKMTTTELLKWFKYVGFSL